MVVIRQHSDSGELNDFTSFLSDVSAYVEVDQWQLSIKECVGKGAPRLQKRSHPDPLTLSPSELRKIYQPIKQTIDGSFVGFCQGQVCCRLEAVDSSYWRISGPRAFENHMLVKYGEYEPARA